MGNKGKKLEQKMGNYNHITYYCKRCGIWVHEKQWNNDTHSNCDKQLKKRHIRDSVDKRLFGKILK